MTMIVKFYYYNINLNLLAFEQKMILLPASISYWYYTVSMKNKKPFRKTLLNRERNNKKNSSFIYYVSFDAKMEGVG